MKTCVGTGYLLNSLNSHIIYADDVKNPARGHNVEKHHPEGKKRTTYSLHMYEEKTAVVQKYSEKATSPSKQKEKRK